MARRKKVVHVHGDGSVYRRKDGRLAGDFTDENGKRHTVYGKTEDECWEKIEARRAEIAKGQYVQADRMTVSEWASEWLDSLKKINYRAKSYQQRKSAISAWIDPLLGTFQMQKLRPDQIQKLFVEAMIEERLAANTIRSYCGALHDMFERAVIRGIVAKNPCEHLILPKVKRVERPILTMEQIDLFLAELKGDWLAPMAELALYTAMREGEICALKESDIDFEGSTVMIHATVAWITGRGFVVGRAKTDSSERRISLAPCAVDLLLRQCGDLKAKRRFLGPEWNKLGLVFPHENGGYRLDTTIDNRMRSITAKLGLPDGFTFHCLRHTAVAILIKAGAHPKMIQEICGHASIGITMDYYGHLFEGMHREAMIALDQVFSRARMRKEA